MKLDPKEVGRVKALIEKSEKFLIIPHRNPDGDTIGSALALYNVFVKMGKAAEVICLDPPAEVFNFMLHIEQIKTELVNLDYDAVFIVDTGATHLTGRHETHPELFDKSLEVVNIDHHQSNDNFGKYNIVVDDAPAATMVVYQMLEDMGYPIERDTATALLTGLYTDTGSFMHSNATPEAFRIGAKLLAKGANLRSISKEIFNTTKISTMHLWGRAMRSAYQTPDGVTIATITSQDFKDTKSDHTQLTGCVDYINSVPGAQYSVILTERQGKVKGSLRTLKEEVDVAAIAAKYGGGGHTKAAGFAVPGKLEKQISWKVVDHE